MVATDPLFPWLKVTQVTPSVSGVACHISGGQRQCSMELRGVATPCLSPPTERFLLITTHEGRIFNPVTVLGILMALVPPSQDPPPARIPDPPGRGAETAAVGLGPAGGARRAPCSLFRQAPLSEVSEQLHVINDQN